MRLLHDQYRYAFSAVCVADPEGAILAGLPMATVATRLTRPRLVSLPFSDACGPLVGDDGVVRGRLLSAIAAAVDSARVGLEIRGRVEGLARAEIAHRFWAHQLALPSDASLAVASFRPAIRRGVAKAARAGLVAEWRSDVDALRAFYRLHLQTRRRQGVPTQPKQFVLRFADLFREGLGHVLLVRRDADVMAAGVFLVCNGTLTYKYGASDARHLDKRPNNLMMMQAIRWGCDRGCHTFDLGRTDLDNDGLRSFKRGWGAEESELSYTYVARSAPRGAGRLRKEVLEPAIRHGPPALGRIVGAALYRHVG